MKLFRCVLLFCLCISCSSNHKKSQQTDTVGRDSLHVCLDGENLSSDSTLWGLKLDYIGGDELIVEELSCPLLYGVYRIEGDSLIKNGSFLRKGTGPGEVVSPVYQCSDSTLFIANYTSTLKNIYQVKYDDLFDGKSWKSVDIPTDHQAMLFPYFIMLDNNVCIVTGSNLASDKILTAIDLKSNSVSEVDFAFPGFHVAGDLKVADHLVYCDAQLAKHPDLSKFVYTCRLGQFIEILEMDGIKLKKRIPLFSNYPVYSVKKDRRIIDDDCLRGAVTKVTRNRIYCLMTPYTHLESMKNEKYKGLPNYYSDNLYVFDWNGRLLKSYQLDRPVCSFCVDESDTVLLASTLEGEDFVLRRYYLQ